MARRSSRGSVYNKRSNEQVQTARTSGGLLPQAYAQSQNPTQNQSPQARTQSTQFDPWARATQFVHNVGRGGYDVGRSYTTDIADTAHSIATGREQEQRSYRDETLATVFGRGLFEGNLEGSFAEASRRVQEQPGRVVGEVAAETAIMLGTMGFGAVAKGAKVGMTGVKSVRGATKAQGSTGWTRKTGLIRKGQEQKFVGDKTTTIIKTNRKGKVTTKTKKTNILDRMERFGAKGGEKFNKKIGRPTTLGSPMIIGASGKGIDAASGMPGNLGLGNDFNIFSKARGTKLGTKDIPTESITDNIATKSSGLSDENIGYMKQYEQFQSGATSVGDEVDPTFMGSMDNTIVPMIREQEGMGRMFSKKLKDEVDYTQPSGSNTDRKMLDGSDIKSEGFEEFNSGGQGGMDQLALETASEMGFTTGGWMPKGFEVISSTTTKPLRTGIVKELKPNEIFVFGSNPQGRHGRGTAKLAVDKFGAKLGQGEGLQGQSYALPTKKLTGSKMTEVELKSGIDKFITVAKDNPDKEFILSPVGTGLAGWNPSTITKMFGDNIVQPNLRLPVEFTDILSPAVRGRYFESRTTTSMSGKEIAKKFNLKENDVVGYPARTKKNIAETDGTAVFYDGTPSGGTKLTIDEAKRQGKPLIENPTPEEFNMWGSQFNIKKVNIGGPRESNLTQGAKDRVVSAIRGSKVSKTKTKDKGSTQQEWIDFYQGEIESNSGIKRSKGITKTADEKGVGSKDSRVYSTDELDQATKVKKKKPRTHSASIPIDVAAAQVQAETIITSGFGKGQSAKNLKAQLDNLVSGYASEDATIVKTNVQKNPKGAPIPENIGLGTDVEQFGLDKNNQVAGAIPTRIGEIFEEIAPKSFKGYGYRKGKEPKTQKGLIATGKEMKSGGRKAKTGRERLWQIEGEEGGSTELDYNQLSGDDLQIPGVSNMPIDEQDFLVATQIDPVKMVGGKLVGNPQLGLSDQVNAKAAEKALNAILGPVGGSDAGYWAGKRIPHFGYDGFRVKYNLGQLTSQKGVKPTKQLPPKLNTFLQQRNLTYKDYYDLNFQTISRGKDKSLLKRFVDGDVVKEEYTGDVYEDSIWTKENFMAAGSGTRKGDLLPQQNLVEEIKIVNRNRVSPVRKPVVERSSTPWTPKSIIEKDDSLVGFNIKNVRELVKQQGTTAVRRRVSKPSKKVVRKKTKPEKKVTSFADMPSLFDNNLGLNPDTGDVDPTLIRRDYPPPSWFMGGGDTTILGGSIRPKPKQARLKNIKRKPKFNTFISSVLYREDQMDDFAGDRLAEARFRQRDPDWWMP